MNNTIDRTDYAILATIADADKALWKNEIHKQLQHRDDLPGNTVSVQTVGRRVDQLAEDNLLENVITSPDNLARDLIISFTLTEDGRNALETKRHELVKDLVRTNLFPEDRRDDIPREPVLKTARDELNLDTGTTQDLEEYDAQQLTALLTAHYAEQEVAALLDGPEHDLQQLLDAPHTQ